MPPKQSLDERVNLKKKKDASVPRLNPRVPCLNHANGAPSWPRGPFVLNLNHRAAWVLPSLGQATPQSSNRARPSPFHHAGDGEPPRRRRWATTASLHDKKHCIFQHRDTQKRELLCAIILHARSFGGYVPTPWRWRWWQTWRRWLRGNSLPRNKVRHKFVTMAT
jgi:hypothetical protein